MTSFLFGRRRFNAFLFEDFSIRETKAECFINRLSALEFVNVESEEFGGKKVDEELDGRGRGSGFEGLDIDAAGLEVLETLLRIEVRFLGTVGAYRCIN